MATIQITVTRTGQATGSKTLNVADTDMDAIVAAYQSDANVSINGTATWLQVLNYMFNVLLVQAMQTKTQAHQTVPAVTPPPVPIS